MTKKPAKRLNLRNDFFLLRIWLEPSSCTRMLARPGNMCIPLSQFGIVELLPSSSFTRDRNKCRECCQIITVGKKYRLFAIHTYVLSLITNMILVGICLGNSRNNRIKNDMQEHLDPRCIFLDFFYDNLNLRVYVIVIVKPKIDRRPL